ncbi:MAG: S-methyl-5-thioribose-1-phosphate isomerase [Gammaproteobacteria bacterium 28-57-27]|nr:MAG: S-methyl-5-thioribose-1-phosphate isomerase [Gammaproteobacteria bacterium 28-57-27]
MQQFDSVRALRWTGQALELLDQRRLPHERVYLACASAQEVAVAIRDMVVRGAPAIGVAAAYGVVLAAQQMPDVESVRLEIQKLAESRPTAVNLFWALQRMGKVLDAGGDAVRLEREALAIEAEDIAANRRMGELGAALIEPGLAVLTHCNTGSLATAGFGTALGVIRSAYAQQRITQVFADETRPWLQGARLTAWELQQDGIPVTLQCEGAAASLLRTGQVGWVIVGADRITANGDTANKIGTYGLAILARHHGVKFMVVAPTTTFDLSLAHGGLIPIETRPMEEVTSLGGRVIAPEGVAAWNPSFDVTPADLIDAIVTERGVIVKPTTEAVRMLLA